MSDLMSVIKEIEKGRNLEVNLPKYMNSMMSTYHRYSGIRLALNYYTYFEMVKEGDGSAAAITKLAQYIDTVISKVILGDFDGEVLEEGVKQADQVRTEIIREMNSLTLYADQFQIYEYIMNRIEGNYEEVEALPLNYADDRFVKILEEYIIQDRDNSVISSKMMEVVSNLPMRLSRQRYYEIVRDSFLLFEGAEKQSLEEHSFLLRSSAALLEPEEDAVRYRDLDSILHSLREADYDTLSAEQYLDLKQKLIFVSEYMERMTSLYRMLVEVVNDVYVLLLSMPYALMDAAEMEICKKIIRMVQSGDTEEDTLFALFEQLEGKQERLYEQLAETDYLITSLEGQKDLMESMMLDKIYASLKRMEKLSSTSHFIDLDQIADRSKVDRGYAEARAKEVIDELAEKFKNSSKREIRSIMAASMMALPVFFQSIKEFEEYAGVSLMSCSDMVEKTASVTLLNMIMNFAPCVD